MRVEVRALFLYHNYDPEGQMEQTPRILVVDPNPAVREMVALEAKSMVKELLQADSISAARPILATGPEVVFTEVSLPDGSGDEVLAAALHANPLCVVVAMAGEEDVAALVGLMQQGAFSVITKPFARSQLVDALNRALRQQALLVQAQRAREFETDYARTLEAHVARETSLISSLLQFSNQLNAVGSIEDAVGLIMNTFQRMLRCRRMSFLLKTPETGQFAVVNSVGLPPEVLKRPIDLDSSPIVRAVVNSGAAIHSREDADKTIAIGRAPGTEFLSVPLIVVKEGKRDVFGVINLTDRDDQQPFSETELKIIGSMMESASIACSNLRTKMELEKNYFDTVGALALALEAKDPYTHGHSQRVTTMCMTVAEAMGFDNESMDQIMFAGMLHDVGKIGISEAILGKKGKLTDDEYEKIKKHPVVGERMVNHISFLKGASLIIRHHHERWDGSGYPDGLRGDEIELAARVMAIADSYDAMTTNRPYRKRLSRHQVLEELEKGKGTQFDPEVLDVFLAYVVNAQSPPPYAEFR